MDNGSLRDKINENLEKHQTVPLLPYNEVKHIAKSVLLGLLYLHNLNIIHRDIKADNILINQNVYIYILILIRMILKYLILVVQLLFMKMMIYLKTSVVQLYI